MHAAFRTCLLYTSRPSDIEQLKEDEWSIQGCAPLDDVAEELDAVLPTDTYDTFGGYICGMIDRVPNDGERFRCESEELVIDVMEVENHTIGATVVTVSYTHLDVYKRQPLSTVWERKTDRTIRIINNNIYINLGRKILFIFKRDASLAGTCRYREYIRPFIRL